MVLNPLLMGKLRQGVMAVAAGLALAGCNEANAEDNSKAEIQKVAAVVETADQVKARCRALSSETEAQKDVKRACFIELKAMRQAEITALDKQTEMEQSTGATLDTTIEGLTNEVEGLKKVVALQEQPTQ